MRASLTSLDMPIEDEDLHQAVNAIARKLRHAINVRRQLLSGETRLSLAEIRLAISTADLAISDFWSGLAAELTAASQDNARCDAVTAIDACAMRLAKNRADATVAAQSFAELDAGFVSAIG